MLNYFKYFMILPPISYRSQYRFNSLITTPDNAKTAIKLGTAKNRVTASDKFIIL